MSEFIKIRGARVHNLKSIDVDIPKNKLVVITGLSGSGKSSLAFDTIYAEGRRRYVESLSSYARQFLGKIEKADVDKIEGLSPAIAIDQRSATTNPRSTVGTLTEVYDLLRVLFTNFGSPHCPKCKKPVRQQSMGEIGGRIMKMCTGSDILLFAPIVRNKKGQHKQALKEIAEAGYKQVRVDGYICPIEEALERTLDKAKSHTIEILVDRLKDRQGRQRAVRLGDLRKASVGNNGAKNLLNQLLELAVDLGNGLVSVYDIQKQNNILFSRDYACYACGISLERPTPNMFSFNSPQGACPACAGLGSRLEVDENLVIPNKKLSLAEGAVRPWSRISGNGQQSKMEKLKAVAAKYDFTLDLPIEKLSQEQLKIILSGEGISGGYAGVSAELLAKHRQTDSDFVRREIEKYMSVKECSQCGGLRLKKEALTVLLASQNISEVCRMTLDNLIKFLNQIEWKRKEAAAAGMLIREISARLVHLVEAGVNYLSLDRATNTLSGGEVQKIRLATQIGSDLTGVIYVLDEPSIGLHQKDNAKLIGTLNKLKKLGNSVIVVEHDGETIKAADYVIDVGPGAGKHGGRVVAKGTPAEIKNDGNSLTGAYLSGRKKINLKKAGVRRGNGKRIEIVGASEFNLKQVDVAIPLGCLVCVSGVSGSGKSTLVADILSRALARHFYKAKEAPGRHKLIKGLEYINKVVTIDQSPIGRTPRSNPATYSGVFTHIRELYARQPEAKIKGFGAGHFSFNVKGGRCEACQGDGVVRMEMHFLSDFYLECEECKGLRYNQDALDIYWRGKNIAQVLGLTVEEGVEFFYDIPNIKNKLKVLGEVGLGYIHLGQPATTLSGGEAQRVKLATELARRATGRTLYILDEPTIGLHFEDIERLLQVLNRLVGKGNTVLVVEHNLDVLKAADYIIDLGPEGGDKGGEVVAAGTPEQVAAEKRSYTGQFLKRVI